MAQTFDAAIAQFAPRLPLTVALSGGADSTALLLACVRRWPGQVRAVHVNHGLQVAAAQFQSHCQGLCAELGVPLTIVAVRAQPAHGESPEDAARKARYRAFDALAIENSAQVATNTIAFAHNADDQTETYLLALSRGSGLPGLSGMPAQWQRGPLHCHRPLLGVSARDIRTWLQAQAVVWVEDPTNVDQRYTRNRIRHSVLPALRQAFAHIDDAVARSVRHMVQAQQLLEGLAREDLHRLAGAGANLSPNAQSDALPTGLPDVLSIVGLRALAAERQANLLRYWFKARFGVTPSTAQLEQLLHQLAACSTRGHGIHLRVANGFAQRKGGALSWHADSAGFSQSAS